MSRDHKQIQRIFAALVLALTATVSGEAPSMAAGFHEGYPSEPRRSVAAAVAYWHLPLGAGRREAPQGGLSLRYRYSRGVPLTMAGPEANALDLRLLGRAEPSLYFLHRPVTGRKSRATNLRDNDARTALIAGAAVAGAFVLYQVLKDDEEGFCLDPKNPLCKIPSQ